MVAIYLTFKETVKSFFISNVWEFCFFHILANTWYENISCSVMSNSLRPHGLQPKRPCPSLAPGAYVISCPSSWWCHPTISSCHPLLLPPSVFPSIRVFSNESVLHIRWPKYWSFSFSISPSKEYSGLNSFMMDCWISLQSMSVFLLHYGWKTAW